MVVQTVAFVKVVISRAGGLRECPLGEIPPSLLPFSPLGISYY